MPEKDKPIQKLPSDLLQNLMNLHFNVRKTQNEYKAILLIYSKEFNNNIINIRKKLCIPDLTPKEDLRIIEQNDEVISSWLESEPQGVKKKLDQEIFNILEKSKSPDNFYDWLKNYILYGKPPYSPLYNLELILGNPKSIKEVDGLTTSEKKYIFQNYKQFIKNQTIDNKKEIIKLIKELLSKKLNQRSRRTILSSIATFKLGEKKIKPDRVRGKNINGKIEYDDLVYEIYEAKGDEGNVIQKKQKLRTQRKRLLKDIKEVDKKFKK